MACASCGAENPPGNKFCGACGTALVLACGSCGTSNPPTNRFCGECGMRLAGPPEIAAAAHVELPAAPPTGPPSTTRIEHLAGPAPDSYTPRHLADRILASRAALEGERKQVSVLFADIVSSTELVQDLDPEEAKALLEPAVRAMLSAVHRFEGTVCRVMGDGIMALFGAPLAHEDHAARACYAALTVQDAIRAYGDRVRARNGVELHVRVGLNSGEVVVGSISNDLYVEYSAIGLTTHLAARMEQLAVPGTIRLTGETARLVDGLVELRSLGTMPVKGVSRPVAVFELLGAGPNRRRFQVAAERGLTPFVGRDAEMLALGRALALALSGHGQVVALVGEPGVGKSRLLHEFTHADAISGWRLLQAGAASAVYADADRGKAISYLPVIDLLRTTCGIEPRDDARTMREKLTGSILSLDPALGTILPALLALLDLPVEDEGWAILDPAGRRCATLDALRRLLLRESQRQPLLLVFEDLHWIDAETQELLDTLVEALPAARILLLVTYRPEYTHPWNNKSYYTQLRIDPLGQASAESLLAAILGDDPRVAPLAALTIERTDGNPFFLEESIREFVETGVLIGERGAYRLTRPVERVRVPATVQAVLAARIDRLPADEKRLLQTAAVIGKDVPFALLQRIAETPDTDLQTHLARLQAGELLYPVSLFPDLELTFKHALTHEVAYGGLLQERRRALHAQIVTAIEARYPDRLDEYVERLAHHAVQGYVWERAATYCWQAGQRAMARSAAREAVDFLEQALAALAHLPQSPEVAAREIDVRFELRTALWMLIEYGAAHEQIRRAESMAQAIGDRHRLGRALSYQAQYLRTLVDHREAVETGERAIAVARELGDLGMQVAATDVAAASYHEMGQFSRAIELTRANIAAVTGVLAHDRLGQHQAPSVSSRVTLGFCLSWLGEFDEAVEQTQASIPLADAVKHPNTRILARISAGLVHTLKGDLSRAIPLLEEALDIGKSIGMPSASAGMCAFTGHAYTLAGRVDEAIDLLERSQAEFQRSGHRPCTSLWTGWLADAYLQAGRLDDAHQTAERAIALARAHHERGFEGMGYRQLGDVLAAAASPDFPAAERLYGQALAIAEDLGMRPLQAHTHLSLGKLYRRTGREHDARAALNVALDLYLTMEMRHWIPEAEAELAAVV